MRVAAALLLIGLATTAGVRAQDAAAPAAPPPAAAAPVQTPSPSPNLTPAFDLPVSLDRIRKELGRPPLFPILDLRDQPTFRVEVQERNRLQDILSTLDFSGGPVPAGAPA